MSQIQQTHVQRRHAQRQAAMERLKEQPRPTLSGFIEGAGNLAGDVVEFTADVAGKGLGYSQNVSARLTGELGRGATYFAANGLDSVGLGQTADNLRDGGDDFKRMAEAVGKFSQRTTEGFVSGVGDGVAGTVEGLAGMVAHPHATAKSLYQLGSNAVTAPAAVVARPFAREWSDNTLKRTGEYFGGIKDVFVEDYGNTKADHGVAGALGRGVFDVGTLLMTGGSGAAAKAPAAINTGNRVSRVGQVAQKVAKSPAAKIVKETAKTAVDSGTTAEVNRAETP